MKALEAFTVSIGLLAAVDTFFTAEILPLPVWVTFIAWASFYIVGGGVEGFVKSVSCNLTGLAISSLALVGITLLNGDSITASIFVGIGSAAMVQASRYSSINILPAIVWGFASTVGTTVATGKSILTPGLLNPALVAAAALVVGASFGYISEVFGNALTSKRYR